MDRLANVDRSVMVADSGAARTVAIIGGGYAGLAAAVTLAENGVRTVVYEAGKTLGGRARRIEYRGEILDNGQHILAGAYRELLRLMRVVEVPDTSLRRVSLRLSMPPDFLLRAPSKTLFPGQLYMAWTLLTAKGLSVADRWAAIRLMSALKRAKYQLDNRLTVAELLAAHRQPQNLIDHLWQPLTISALNTPLACASAQVFAHVLRDSLASDRNASDLLLPCVDLSALFPDPAAGWLINRGGQIWMGQRVNNILVTDRGYQVSCGNDVAHFDAIILAVGPHQLSGLLAGVESPKLDYEPIVTIYFKFDRPVHLPEPMLGQAKGLAQWFFDRTALSGNRAAADETGGLIAAVISASGPHMQLTQEALAEQVLAELVQHVSQLPKPLWRKVVSEQFATFACTPLADRPPVETSFPGVFRAGDYVAGDYPATLEGAVRNGVKAAESCLTFLNTVE
ncbi:MAG: hydroxysqualene dehydroxylase HpnE [Betaproteobacteria bacterium]